MAASRPVTDTEREQIRAMHAEGRSRNEIARALGRSGRVISRQAEQMGLSFDRAPMVAAATAAKKEDARAKRAALALALLDDAARLREQLWQPHTYWDWGGKDHAYDEVTRPEPTPADKLKLMQAVGAAVDRAIRIDQYDADPGLDAGKSMLAALAEGLGQAYEQLQQRDADADQP